MTTMMSTGNLVVLSPAPITDTIAMELEMINQGGDLLDLDNQQNRYDSSSPLSSNSYFVPSPDMQSFYPDPSPYTPLGSGYSTDDFGETEMIQLLMREMIPDILADCQKLNLHPNVYAWTPADVQRWIMCVMNRFELTEVDLQNFFIDGITLSQLQDADFRMRAPKCGDVLFSITYILKQSLHDQMQAPQVVPQIPAVQLPQVTELQHIPTTLQGPFQPVRYTVPVSPVASPHDCESGSTGSPSDDESSIPSPAPSGPNTSMTPNHTGGIQLWQFLKELLLQPNSYSYCIRWLNRPEGIFKIEDSVEVARLWGMRKNRPAMNYDKLSRSIRQYYRKGIMKKTEVSQRLVYQFVNPC